MIRYLLIISLVLGIACRKEKWNERNKPLQSQNLLEAVQANANLSRFYEYLVKTGYDKVIASSKTFTVWAPVNAAWDAVDPALLNDTTQLRLLVANHIATQTYGGVTTTQRIATLNGKKVAFTAANIEGISISTADQYAANGVLQVIDGALIPKPNAWEYLNSTSYQQKDYLHTLEYIGIDTVKAEQVGVNPTTGAPIYKPGTGEVQLNRFLERININSEDSSLTYVILADDVFNQEQQQLKRFYTDSTDFLTDSTTKWHIVKDLVFNGVYDKEHLPAVLYSIRDSVQFHINSSDIISTRTVSNGVVYVVNHISYELPTKIKPVIIEGEYFSTLRDATKAYSIRTRMNPNTGGLFRDYFITGHAITAYWVNYRARLNSVSYKVYWVAVNDFQTNTFTMRVAFQDPNVTTLPYVTVDLNKYDEIYLGDYTIDRYGLSDVYLVANATNPLVLDYIKLVPILN